METHDDLVKLYEEEKRKEVEEETTNYILLRDYEDDIVYPIYDKCAGIQEGFCTSFHHAVGFDNAYIVYSIVMGFSVFLCFLYGCFICKKYSNITFIIKWHAGIFLVNVTVWFWALFLILINKCGVSSRCCPFLYGGGVAAACALLSILDCLFFAPEGKYFRRQRQLEEVDIFVEKMKAAKPEVGVFIKCYHTYTTKVNNTNVTKKAITHTDYRHFPFDSFVDETFVPKIPDTDIVLFHLTPAISAGNAASDEAFNQFRNRFIAANQYRDQAMETSVGMLVPGFINPDTSGLFMSSFFPSSTRIMTVRGTPPWWARGCWFYVLSLLNISILQRILFRTRSKYFSVVLRKKYFADPKVFREYDFDSGVVRPSVVNNIILPPKQEFGQP